MWSKQQRQCFGRATSWLYEKSELGYQVFWITFTSAANGRGQYLAEDLKELEKRVRREYGYEVEHFYVETVEGNGVVHGFWAIRTDRAVWIPIEWLRREWETIHGAWNCHISRVSGKQHKKNAAGYMCNQYLAGQSLMKRYYYSWWKCKVAIARGWNAFKRLVDEKRPVLWHERMYGREVAVRDRLPMRELVEGWQSLLEFGWCMCDGHVYQIEGRRVVERRVYHSFELTGLPDEAII